MYWLPSHRYVVPVSPRSVYADSSTGMLIELPLAGVGQPGRVFAWTTVPSLRLSTNLAGTVLPALKMLID